MHIDESKKFDKRTIEKNLKEGIVSAAEWKKFLRSLPDVSDKVEFIVIEEEEKGEATEDQQEKSEETVEKEEAPEKE